jgi:hypothetical protein
MFVVAVTQFKRMQKIANFTDVTTDYFLLERLFARKSRHMATCFYGTENGMNPTCEDVTIPDSLVKVDGWQMHGVSKPNKRE